MAEVVITEQPVARADGGLYVKGLVDGVQTTNIGHVEWTTSYCPDGGDLDDPKDRRKMTAAELRGYCEQLLLEAAGKAEAAVKLPKINVDKAVD